ncbi:glycosyltransferase [Candidatus Dojkabacteria bacterium]|nr:glycosyltransferase [Candidatus Dojkabacteria bacterium]
MRPTIIIAAFNETYSIKKVVTTLRRKGYDDIIVVDDGSFDNTSEQAEKAGAIVLRHIINRGQGAALKTGIDYALLKGSALLVTFDADGQHNANEIDAMITPILNEETDITLGSRFLGRATNLPFLKWSVLKIGTFFVYLLYGIKLTDSQNGFRALSRKSALQIQITSDRMEHAGEIIGEIRRNKLRYKEVPVTISYTKYSLGKGQKASAAIALGIRMIIRRFIR